MFFTPKECQEKAEAGAATKYCNDGGVCSVCGGRWISGKVRFTPTRICKSPFCVAPRGARPLTMGDVRVLTLISSNLYAQHYSNNTPQVIYVCYTCFRQYRFRKELWDMPALAPHLYQCDCQVCKKRKQAKAQLQASQAPP